MGWADLLGKFRKVREERFGSEARPNPVDGAPQCMYRDRSAGCAVVWV